MASANRDGLLRAGEPGTQLTWMDAKVGDWVVTPRWGKAVEINALWLNALHVTVELARRARDKSARPSAKRCWSTRQRTFPDSGMPIGAVCMSH